MTRGLATLVCLIFCLPEARITHAEDWPAWRGGEKQGISTASTNAVTWSSDENIKWQTDIPGRGHSSPVVSQGRVYVTTGHSTTSANNLKFAIAILRQLLLMLTVACVIAPQDNRFITNRRFMETVASTGIGAALLVISLLEIFGEGVLDVERCPIRSWLSSGITISLCIALMQYQSRANSEVLFYLGIAGVALGAIIFFFVPNKDHAFLGGYLNSRGSLVVLVSLLPTALGLMAFGNFLSFKTNSNRKGWIACFHFLVATLLGAWTLHLVFGLTETMPPFHFLVFTTLGLTATLFFIFILFSWGFAGIHNPRLRENSAKPTYTYRSFILHSALIGISLAIVVVALCSVFSWSFFLRGHFSHTRWIPGEAWGSAIAIFLNSLVALAILVLWRRFRPVSLRAAGQINIILLAILVSMGNYATTIRTFTRSVVCVDAESGKVLWIASALDGPQEQLHRVNTPASPTPIVQNDRIYAAFGSGVYCCDSEGEVIWTNRDVSFESLYGMGSSPVIVNGILVISNLMFDTGYVVGVNCETGKEVWRHNITNIPTNFTGCSRTPCITTIDGQIVVVVWAYDEVNILDPNSGRLLWYRNLGDGRQGDMVSSAVCDGEYLYCSSKRKTIALKISLKENVDPVIWERRNVGSNICSPVLSDGMLLTISDNGIAACLDAASGEVQWRKRLPGQYYASPVKIGDYVYFCNLEGKTTVIRSGPSYEPVATNDLQEATFASLAPSSSALFLRTEKRLLRIEY